MNASRFTGSAGSFVATLSLLCTILLLSCVIRPAPSSAAERRKVTLDEAVDFAVKRRGDLKAARLGVKVQQAENTQVNAKFMPVLTGNASANIGLAGSFAGLGLVGLSMSPYKRLIGGSVDAVWEVFDFGRTVAESLAESHEVDAARHSAANMERIVRFRTNDLYLQCLAAQTLTSLAQKQVETASGAAEIATKHAKAQIIAMADAEIALLQQDQSKRELLAAQGAEHTCTVHLAGYIGAKFDLELVDIADDNEQAPAASSSLVADALKNRPDHKARIEQAEAWDSRVTAAGLDHLPKVRAVGSLGWALLNEQVVKQILQSDLNHAFYALGVGIQVPIFEGGAIHARMRANQHRRDSERARAKDLKRRITAQVRAAANAWRVAMDQQRAAQSEATRAERVEKSAYKRFKAGLSNVHAWTTARELSFRSRVAFQSARYRRMRARNALHFAAAMYPRSTEAEKTKAK